MEKCYDVLCHLSVCGIYKIMLNQEAIDLGKGL